MLEVLALGRRVHANRRLEGNLGPVGLLRRHIHHARLGQALREVHDADRVLLRAVQAQAFSAFALFELQRHHAHADKVRAMDTLEAFRERRADAQQHGALRRPVARAAAAVHLAGYHDQRNAGLLVAHGRIEQRDNLVLDEVAGPAALLAFRKLVGQLHVGERSAHHDLVIAATGTVGVEVRRNDAAFLQVLRRRGVQRDAARRRDVVGGDEVAQERQRTRVLDGLGRRRLRAHAVEVRRAAHVRGGFVPRERVGRLAAKLLPGGVAVVQAARPLLEQLLRGETLQQVGDLGVGRPDVGQLHRRAIGALAQHGVGQIHVHGASQRVSDHRCRRAQVVLRHVRRDAALEVAVARKHAGKLQVVGDIMQRRHNGAGVADAAHAAEAARVKAQVTQSIHQAGTLKQQLGGMAARSQDALHPRLGLQPRFGGLLGHQTGRQHHGRVGGGGAASHRGDGKRAVTQLACLAVHVDRFLLAQVKAAIGANLMEALLRLLKENAIMRARRAGDAALHAAQVQLDHVGVHALGRLRVVPEALRLRILLHQRHLLFAAAGQAQVRQRLVVNGEQRAGAAVFRRHIGNARTLRGVQTVQARAEALDEAADDTLLAQHLRERQRHVHGRDALGQLTRQTHAHDLGNQRGDRLAQRRSFGLDAADAPAQHTDAVGGRRVAVRAHQRVKVHRGVLPFRRFHTGSRGGHGDLRELLDVQLMADARSRRDDAHVLE